MYLKEKEQADETTGSPVKKPSSPMVSDENEKGSRSESDFALKKPTSPMASVENEKGSRSGLDFIQCQQSEEEPNGHELNNDSVALIRDKSTEDTKAPKKKKILFV